ncbi:MAG: ABC transporter permease [Dehalococcoidia bacterium]
MAKLLDDALVIAWLHAHRLTRPPVAFLLGMILFPVPMLFLARYLVPEGVDVGPRLIAGSMVFSVGLSAVQGLAASLNADRFTYRLRLIRSYPVHRVSYAAGMLLAGTAQAVLGACLLVLLAPVLGIEVHLSVWLLPVAILTAISLSGLALVISTRAPTWEAGNMLAGIAGIFVVLMSPIYFPVSRLPEWLQPVARLSPYTYAADALNSILSGQAGFFDEMAILAAITVASLCIGIAGMRWREV